VLLMGRRRSRTRGRAERNIIPRTTRSGTRIGSRLTDAHRNGPVINISVEEYEKEISDKALNTESVESNNEKNHIKTEEQTKQQFISFEEIDSLLKSGSKSELDLIWEGLNEYDMDRETAALIMSARRFFHGNDKSLRNYSNFLGEQMIAHFHLSGDLENTNDPLTKTQNQSQMDLDQGKTRREVEQTIREGQTQFRNKLLDHYGASCMVSGVKVLEVLEAAHILPYNGQSTNDITNGMILRSDIHRLFDKGLLGFRPEDFTISISPNLECTEYQAYSGKKLKLNKKAKFDNEAISKRWKEFKSNNN